MLRIVLVEPREAGNVGAAARAMKNFGFTSLVIAGPHPELLPVAGWWASGADDVLEAAVHAPTLEAAIADAHLTVATTSLRGRPLERPLDPVGVAELHAGLGEEQTLALVFGREDRGLTHEEVALCQRVASIPTSESFPTMNLAQAVGVFCFAAASRPGTARDRELARADEVERLHRAARALLSEAGFLDASNPDRIYDDLRAMAGRADLDAREIAILLGIVRQLDWAMHRHRGQ